ncbi:DNA-binding transcriptional regulator YdaS, prophage-encoded, Cro superfamily [Novosphingobium sp. CF614]|uniref:transcriptional regulator n=1 Tax=Novosphingobium sp. CF614 TaxID=1884364 RepID=UPI0008E1D17A|nr:YdaS family helix-turn-helix protein [Novosphingobium sp. CF614]SFG08898.1 DNA-binding transcriptional regulator YdaS, prophage-encoded, Cro superfamily [Novosphingobium sp. CF614]
MNTITRYEALRKVRSCFETEQAMADAFDISQPTVWRWLNQSRQMPPQHVLLAEKLTGVSRHLLRPDIYPIEPEASSRWSGVDRCAGVRANGIDRRAAPVAFNTSTGPKGAAA